MVIGHGRITNIMYRWFSINKILSAKGVDLAGFMVYTGGSMEEKKIEMQMEEMQKKIYELVSAGTQEDLLMSSAVLMKTAIELYTIILPDEDIESMLTNEIVDSIPAIREKMQGSLKPTVH